PWKKNTAASFTKPYSSLNPIQRHFWNISSPCPTSGLMKISNGRKITGEILIYDDFQAAGRTKFAVDDIAKFNPMPALRRNAYVEQGRRSIAIVSEAITDE